MGVKNSITQSNTNNNEGGIAAYMTREAVQTQINSIVGGKNGQRFISAVVSAVNNNPALKKCTNQSICAAALIGEALNLHPSPQLGHYYMVPFNTKDGGTVAQFQLGYKGYIQLALRSGQYKKLTVIAIKEGELVRFDPLNEEIVVNLIEDEDTREEAATMGYYAMFEYTNGFRKAMYWSKAKMERHAMKYSQGYRAQKGFTFWEKDFDAMAYKTMLRQLISKWGIMSIEMVTAMDSDMAVINEDGTKDYVDNTEDTLTIDATVVDEQPTEPQPIENLENF